MTDRHSPEAAAPDAAGARKLIGILLFDDVEELDAVGPWEVLAAWTRTHPEDGYEVAMLSADGGPVTASKGLAIGAHLSFESAPPLAIVVHPGGFGTRALMKDAAHLDRVRAWSAAAELTVSVCTGSLVYAAAGLLAGRPATTHWSALELLAATDPSIQVDPEARYVESGEVITSAGVSAGIDMALRLVQRLAGTERAREVKREIQYEPQPPV